MKSLAERIATVKAETGWSNAELGRRAGTSRAAPSDWLNGKVHVLSALTAQRLSESSPYSATWLATGDGPKTKGAQENGAEYVGLAPKQTMIPVVGIAQLGENGWYDEVQNVGSDGYIEHFSNDEDAYVLEVKGDSMFPAIRSGWYVVVEPNGGICNGEYVAVSLMDGRKLVKELLFKSADTVHLESVNGGERLTLSIEDIATMHPVAAVVSPSKHREG